MKKNIVFTLALASCVALYAQSADEIVTSSRNRIDADTVSSRSRMIITAKDGTTSERLIDQYSADDADGNTRTMIVFQKPASVAGTRFLTIERKNADDRWIFLPALGKVRRISSSEGSGSFVGTDFSYDDISSSNRDASEDIHTLLREETVDGLSCYVIESVPKDSGYQYSKMVSWIEKESSVMRRIELYTKKDGLVKLLEVLKTDTVQGFVTPMITKMSTIKDGTATTINVDIIQYNKTIPDGVFTTDYLSTGRVK